MITKTGLDDQLVHYNPPLCLPKHEPMTWNDVVRCSNTIESVTCQFCVYYYFYPEARGLEIDYRNRRK